jgi:hypothetical protein
MKQAASRRVQVQKGKTWEGTCKETDANIDCLAVCFMLVSCLTYSSTLEMEAIFYSETSAGFHETTLRYIPEDRTRMEAKIQAFLTLVLDGAK